MSEIAIYEKEPHPPAWDPVVRARLGRDRWPARLRGPSETGARAHREDGCLRAPTRSSRVLRRLSNSRTSGGDPRSPADWNGAPSPRGGGASGASRTSPDSDLPPRRPRGGRTAASPVQLRRGGVVRFATLDAPTTTMVRFRRYEGFADFSGGISGQRAKVRCCISREELIEFTGCRVAVGRRGEDQAPWVREKPAWCRRRAPAESVISGPQGPPSRRRGGWRHTCGD